jgi:cytochrome c553
MGFILCIITILVQEINVYVEYAKSNGMKYKQGWIGFLLFIIAGVMPLAATESPDKVLEAPNTQETPKTQEAPVAQANQNQKEDQGSKENQPAATQSLMGDPVLGQQKSQVCVACHGADGNSVVPAWPKIAGQLERYLVKELKEYRKGEKGGRFDPTMYPMTQSLSDSDIADLAAYFSKQTETIGNAKADLLALGEKIYRVGNLETGVPACAACHSPDGMANGPAIFPRLSGQFPEYTVDQLKKFRDNKRSDDPNGIMRDIAKRMTDEEMQAVSSYVSGLH